VIKNLAKTHIYFENKNKRVERDEYITTSKKELKIFKEKQAKF